MLSNPFITEESYSKEVKLRKDKVVHLRKWKAKDRKRFRNVIEEKGENLSVTDISMALVFPCILEKNILLTEEEIKYISTVLREISISETFDFEFYCTDENCENDNKVTLRIEDVNKPKYSEWGEVEINGGFITFGERVKPDFYYKAIYDAKTQFDKELVDLTLHIIKVEQDDTKTFPEMLELLDNLDTDVMDKIVEEFNKQRFVQDSEHSLKCSKCGKEHNFIFDEIEGFFPETWTK